LLRKQSQQHIAGMRLLYCLPTATPPPIRVLSGLLIPKLYPNSCADGPKNAPCTEPSKLLSVVVSVPRKVFEPAPIAAVPWIAGRTSVVLPLRAVPLRLSAVAIEPLPKSASKTTVPVSRYSCWG